MRQTESNSNSINIDLVSKNGTIIYSNHDRKSILHTKPEIQQLISSNNVENTYALINRDNNNSIINANEISVSSSQGSGYLDYKGSGWILILSEKTATIFSDIQRIVNQYIYIAAIIIIVSIIIILLIARNISLPLSKANEKSY